MLARQFLQRVDGHVFQGFPFRRSFAKDLEHVKQWHERLLVADGPQRKGRASRNFVIIGPQQACEARHCSPVFSQGQAHHGAAPCGRRLAFVFSRFQQIRAHVPVVLAPGVVNHITEREGGPADIGVLVPVGAHLPEPGGNRRPVEGLNRPRNRLGLRAVYPVVVERDL